jgi:prepilin peptidase CpaA
MGLRWGLSKVGGDQRTKRVEGRIALRDILLLAFELLFIFCVIYAMMSDYRWLHIPNAVSIILAVAFFPFAWLAGPAIPFWAHLIVAGAVFLLLFGFFALGWLGGGDVKLIGAIMLWTGPSQGVSFIVLFALFGGVLALILVSLRFALPQYPQIETMPVLSTFSRWARANICPYALPIGLAALCVAPSIFARA